MSHMVACPDCGTPNRVDAELCVQCWRGMNEDLASRIPTPAFAGSNGAPPPPAPGRPAAAPRPEPARVTIQPATPKEADPGAVPYFAAVGGAPATPAPSFPLPSSPGTSVTTKTAAPWGAIVTLAVLAAILAGGYLFFFGGKSGTYSPEDGSYTVAMPAGEWEPMDELPDDFGGEVVDLMLKGPDQRSFVMTMHMPVPGPLTPEMLKAALTQAQQYMPRVPGLTVSPIQESTLVTGEGLAAYELSASGGNAADGIGKMRMVLVSGESSKTLALMMLACGEPQCATAEPAFDEMAKSFEFSG